MRIRKLTCMTLIPLLAISFFTSFAAAKPSCNENTCLQMAMRTGHHPAEPMTAATDCCARHQQAPCELERRQSIEISAFCISSGRLENHPFDTIIETAFLIKPQQHADKVFYQSAAVEAKARSVPIYLLNLSLIC